MLQFINYTNADYSLQTSNLFRKVVGCDFQVNLEDECFGA